MPPCKACHSGNFMLPVEECGRCIFRKGAAACDGLDAHLAKFTLCANCARVTVDEKSICAPCIEGLRISGRSNNATSEAVSAKAIEPAGETTEMQRRALEEEAPHLELEAEKAVETADSLPRLDLEAMPDQVAPVNPYSYLFPDASLTGHFWDSSVPEVSESSEVATPPCCSSPPRHIDFIEVQFRYAESGSFELVDEWSRTGRRAKLSDRFTMMVPNDKTLRDVLDRMIKMVQPLPFQSEEPGKSFAFDREVDNVATLYWAKSGTKLDPAYLAWTLRDVQKHAMDLELLTAGDVDCIGCMLTYLTLLLVIRTDSIKSRDTVSQEVGSGTSGFRTNGESTDTGRTVSPYARLRANLIPPDPSTPSSKSVPVVELFFTYAEQTLSSGTIHRRGDYPLLTPQDATLSSVLGRMVDIVQRAHLFHDPKRSRIAGYIDQSLDNAVTLCWWPCHTALPPEYLEYTVKEAIEGSRFAEHPSQHNRKVRKSGPKSSDLMLVVRTDLLKPLEGPDEAADSGPNRAQLGKRKERANDPGPSASTGKAVSPLGKKAGQD